MNWRHWILPIAIALLVIAAVIWLEARDMTLLEQIW